MRSFRYIFTLLLFSIISFTAEAQEIKARVLDAETKEPIQYANVLFGEHHGVVTNDEGYFSFTTGKLPKSIKISSLGYDAQELDPNEVQNKTILLKPSTIELGEVFLSNKTLTPSEILEKVKDEVPNNYDLGLGQKRVFLRQSYFTNIKKFKMEVDESTIPGIDQNLMDRITAEMPKFTDSYREVLGDLYGNYDNQKFKIVKAANLYNPENSQSLEQLTDHLEEAFRKNLKKGSFLKIRSGIIGVKVDEEELEESMADLEKEKKEKTPEEIAESNAKNQKYLKENATQTINSLLGNIFWKEDIDFDLFEKTRKYELTLEGYLRMGENTVYVINFEPKRGADYKGKIYVNTLDYGVHRLDFENVKPLSKFKLFGISTSKDVHKGKMIFTRNEQGKYSINYLEQEKGETVGMDRPLTIIEKNRHVPGRNKQNELDLDLDFRVGEVKKVQLVVYEDRPLEQTDYEKLKVKDDFEYQKFKTYNADFWAGYNIIEPNAAIRKFSALEKE